MNQQQKTVPYSGATLLNAVATDDRAGRLLWARFVLVVARELRFPPVPSYPERDGSGQRHGGREVGGEPIIASGDPAEVLHATEGFLDEMLPSVTLQILASGARGIAPTGDDRTGAVLPRGFTQVVGNVAIFAEQVAHMVGAFKQRLRSLHGVDIVGGQHHGMGSVQHVGLAVDLGCPASTRTADGQRLAPPLPPNAEPWALK